MKETSPELSSLSARVLNGYEPTRAEVLSMAGSLLSQDETGGQTDASMPNGAAPHDPENGELTMLIGLGLGLFHCAARGGGGFPDWVPDGCSVVARFAAEQFFAVDEVTTLAALFDPVVIDGDALVSGTMTAVLQDLLIPATGFSIVFDFEITDTMTSLALLDLIQVGGSDDALDVSVGFDTLSASMGGGNYENNTAISAGRHVVGVTLNPDGSVDRVLDSGAAETSTVDGYEPGTHDELNFFVQAGTNAHLSILHIYSTPLSTAALQAAVEAFA